MDMSQCPIVIIVISPLWLTDIQKNRKSTRKRVKEKRRRRQTDEERKENQTYPTHHYTRLFSTSKGSESFILDR